MTENSKELPADREIDFRVYLKVLRKRRRMIIVFAGIASVLSIAVSLMMPNIYRSTAVIMPQSSDFGGLSSVFGAVAGTVLGSNLSLAGNTDLSTLKNILNSTDVAKNVITELDLMRVFAERDHHLFLTSFSFANPLTPDKAARASAREMERSREILQQEIVTIKEDSKNNSIIISALEKDPELAQKIAEAYLRELERFLNENSMTAAKKSRLFLEGQLAENRLNLSRAEEALKNFQERNNMVAPEKQAELTVTAAADLQTRIAMEEIEMNTMQQTGHKSSMELSAGLSTPTNGGKLQMTTEEDLQNSMTKIKQLKKQLNNLTFGETFSPLIRGQSGGASIPMANVPDLSLEYARLKREAIVQQKIFEFLIQQYEAAKLSETKESISFIVVDRPDLPAKKDQPKRAMITLLGGVAGILFGALTALFMESFYKEKRPFLKNDDPNLVHKIVAWTLR